MFESLVNRLRRRARLRVAVVTPVGPGHAALYAECGASVEAAWRSGHGPFATLSLIAVDDGEGRLGRSRARNIGIDRALDEGADWLFFLDADDLMVAGAFDAMTSLVAGHDAVWGLILGLSPGAARAHLRIPQIVGMDALDDLLLFDPFLTLQMGHFVRAPVAATMRFDESIDAGEDFDYYLRLWRAHRCAKVAREFFINRHARHSTGPRAASAEAWGTAVRGRQRAEREKHGLVADSAAALEIRNRRTAELHHFCRLHGLVSADDSLALSKQMPFSGEIEVNEYQGGSIFLHAGNDDAVCAQLAWTGEYQPFTTAVWQSLAESAAVILDTGAGAGLYALLAARAALQARVVCFETDAGHCARMRSNVKHNGITNIELIESPQYPRIDDYMAHAGIAGAALVRIGDGAQAAAVLAAMPQLLAGRRPDLIVDLAAPSHAGAIAEILQQYGYRCYALDNSERAMRMFNIGQTLDSGGASQLLASVREVATLRKIALAAMGKLADV